MLQFCAGCLHVYELPNPCHEATCGQADPPDHVPREVAQDSALGGTMRWPTISWERRNNGFIFVVDCQPLQRITCGHTPLLHDAYTPLFHRIVNNIGDIFKEGLLPPKLVDDPVLLVKRDQNKLADYLCNVAMDRQRSWRKERRIDMPTEYHWFAVSDGGARAHCSACGWAVGICFWVDRAWKFEPLVVAAEYLDPRVNSFLAEALALEHATLELKSFVKRLTK